MLGLMLACMATAVQVEAPIRLHPENPRYFLFRGKPTILITSGEHYGAVMNVDFDTVKYLDELQARGLNQTRTFSGGLSGARGLVLDPREHDAPGEGPLRLPVGAK